MPSPKNEYERLRPLIEEGLGSIGKHESPQDQSSEMGQGLPLPFTAESVPDQVMMVRKNCSLIESLIGHLCPLRNPLRRARIPAAFSAEKAAMAESLAFQTTVLLHSIVKRLKESDAAERH